MAPGSPYTHAEVHSALQAAHMLEWEHERKHGAHDCCCWMAAGLLGLLACEPFHTADCEGEGGDT